MRAAALFTCLLIASCGNVDSLVDAPPPDSDGGASAVTVTITQNWINERGEVSGVQAVTEALPGDFVAWIPTPGAMGGFEKRTAETTATGLAIRDIPPATTYYLDVVSFGLHQLFVTDLREIDVKFYSLGRRDAVSPTRPTQLTVNVANMIPWLAGDSLAVSCANVDAFGALAESLPHVRGWPAAGARQLAVTFDWAQIDRGFFGERPTPLIDGTKGDSLAISHLRRIESSTKFPYDTVIETTAFGSFTQSDGVGQTLDSAFPATTVPTFLGGGGVSVRAQPHDPNHQRQISLFAPSMLFTLFGADPTNLDMGQMVYPRPPTGWSQWLSADHNFQVIRDTPLGLKQTAFASLRVAAKLTPVAPPTDVVTPILPRVSPPRSPMINRLSFHDPQTVELQPTRAPIEVTWNAPQLIESPPTVYALTIFRLTRTRDQLTSTRVALINRPPGDRSISIPWHLFSAAGYYYLVLTAGSDIGAHDPKIDDIGRTDSTADTVSGILTLQ
jgi:hypothetical protein